MSGAAVDGAATPVAPSARLDPADDRLARCIQCGLCLPSCPTFALNPFEVSGPRGRVRLMRAVAEGDMAVDDPAFAGAMYECLGCRACETACPAGVEFGALLVDARAAVEAAGGAGRPAEFPRDRLLDAVGSPRRLRLGARLVRRWQRTGARLPRMRRALAERAPDVAALLERAPAIPPQGRRWRLPEVVDPADAARDERAPRARGTVALHPGCVQEVLLPEVSADAALVLAWNAWRVVAPAAFRCCGALHAHHGRLDEARALARANVAAFEASGATKLVTTSAGCGAFFEEYGAVLADDPEWAPRGAALAAAAVDVTEQLVAHGVRRPRRPFGLSVAYHDACHLIHAQRVAEAPRMLLGAVPGLDLRPLPESTRCCGAAGIHHLTHPEDSTALRERKVDRVLETGAELLATGNAGCMLQIEAGLRARGSPVRVLHTVSILRRAYELPPLLPR